MKYVLAIIFIVFVAIGFAAFGLKAPAAGSDPEEIALEIQHIKEELQLTLDMTDDAQKTRAIQHCVHLLDNEANTLRQAAK